VQCSVLHSAQVVGGMIHEDDFLLNLLIEKLSCSSAVAMRYMMHGICLCITSSYINVMKILKV